MTWLRTGLRGSLLLTGLLGCGLPLQDQATPVQNLCADDSDCGDGTCVTVEGSNRCVATTADLAGIVFELEGTTADGKSISHVFQQGLSIQGTSDKGILIEDHRLDVPVPLSLAGRFLHHDETALAAGNCNVGADGSVPVRVEIRSSDPLVGLERVFNGASEPTATAEGTVHTFAVPVPSGTYDVYVAPEPAPAGCAVAAPPPRIFPGLKVETDVKLEPEAEAPRRLTGFVLPAGGLDPTTFTIEVVEPKRGLPVSQSPLLPAPVDGQSKLLGGASGVTGTDAAGIAYYYTDGLVLRLSDPEGKLVVHWKLDALDFDGNGEVGIDLADLAANRKPFTAHVVECDVSNPDACGAQEIRPVAGASVTIKSVSLEGDAGKNSNFRVSAESDADGAVDVELVPGTYQVLVVPPSSDSLEDGPAQREDLWEIKEDSQCCGKTFVLPDRALLTGSVETAAGTGVPGLPVLASPTLPGTRDYFSRALESLELLPRQSTATTEDRGLFAMQVDTGTFDIAIQAPTGTGFSWLVLPATVVAPIEGGARLDSLVLPSPAVVTGTASLQGTPAPSALVRAYLPLLDEESGAPARVVAIGEVVTDADGRFVLPLPPTIARDTPSDPEGEGGAATP
jgi:hypothetical protein